MIFGIILYALYGIGYAIGKRETGAMVAGVFLVALFWPLFLGYDLERVGK